MRLGVLATLPSENQHKSMTSVMRTGMNSSGVCSGNRFLVCSGIFHGPNVPCLISLAPTTLGLGCLRSNCCASLEDSKLVICFRNLLKKQQEPQVPCHVIGLKRALTWQLTNLITMQSYSTLFN